MDFDVWCILNNKPHAKARNGTFDLCAADGRKGLMSSFRKRLQKCAVCGAINRFSVLKPVEIDWCDLDMRPGGSLRRQVNDVVQECPDCGYCSLDISWAPKNIDTIWSKIQNRDLLKMKRFPESVKKYLKAAAVAETIVENGLAFIIYLNAAWHCEDLGHEDGFSTIALKAFTLSYGDYKRQFDGFRMGQNDYTLFVKTDLLRRVKDFEAAEKYCEKLFDYVSYGQYGGDVKIARLGDLYNREVDDFFERLVKLESRLIEKKDKRPVSMKRIKTPDFESDDFAYYDPSELNFLDEDHLLDFDLRYMYIQEEIKCLVYAMITDPSVRPTLGYCHAFWPKKKKLLRRRYGIRWQYPAE